MGIPPNLPVIYPGYQILYDVVSLIHKINLQKKDEKDKLLYSSSLEYEIWWLNITRTEPSLNLG